MANLENLTPFAAVSLPALTPRGASVDLVCVAARFAMPAADAPRDACSLHAEQLPPPLDDVYWGDPAASSLRHEAQNAPSRPGTDIYVEGHVHAPLGRPTTEVLAGVRVGSSTAALRAVGDRVYYRSLLGTLALSAPQPFTSLPLQYERSFGGSVFREGQLIASEARNPVGRGLFTKSEQALDQLAPNFLPADEPRDTMRPRGAPAGFGPIARAWQPRLALAGTYDEAWVRTRAPLWPTDFDPRFFHAAAPGLVAERGLQGGELVRLIGLTPAGTSEFVLPRVRLTLRRARRRGDLAPVTLAFDGLSITPDAQAFTLFLRATLPSESAPDADDVDLLRELEPWEDAS